MRTLSTVAYGIMAALALVVVASHVIGPPDPSEVRHGGLTAATVLGGDGSQTAQIRSNPPPSS